MTVRFRIQWPGRDRFRRTTQHDSAVKCLGKEDVHEQDQPDSHGGPGVRPALRGQRAAAAAGQGVRPAGWDKIAADQAALDKYRCPKPAQFAIVFSWGYATDMFPKDDAQFEQIVVKAKAAGFNVFHTSYTPARVSLCRKHGVHDDRLPRHRQPPCQPLAGKVPGGLQSGRGRPGRLGLQRLERPLRRPGGGPRARPPQRPPLGPQSPVLLRLLLQQQ